MLAVVHKRLVPEVFGTAGRGSCIGSVFLCQRKSFFDLLVVRGRVERCTLGRRKRATVALLQSNHKNITADTIIC